MSHQPNFHDSRFGRPIRQLDRLLINKIAAGEVIERPASVIKELVENSFDAGATVVDIRAEKAGTTAISVLDNGCGIPAAQVRLAFSRHATSKIQNLDELFAVASYGFRGEALPSIASVAHLAMTTRYFGESEGTYISFEGGKQTDLRPVSAPIGTKIDVSHIFFNTPARRKFLKSETAEARQIVRVAERMALGRPSASLSLTLNDRTVFRLPTAQSIPERMGALFGFDANKIVEYEVELSGASYLVYLAHPSQARQDRTRICLFINGRSVASSTIIHAVTSGYGEFLSAGRYPLAVVYIAIDASRLDVNVHPTKAEVRLEDERAVHDNLYRIVNKALRDWRIPPISGRMAPHASDGGGKNQTWNPPNDGADYPPQTRIPFSNRQSGSGAQLLAFSAGSLNREAPPELCDNSRPTTERADDIDSRMPGIDPQSVVFLGSINRLYLILLVGGELCIMDQHAAHERILFEGALKEIEQGGAASQSLLFADTVELSAEEYLTFESSREILRKLGFEADPFGGQAVVISSVPASVRGKNPAVFLRELLDDIAILNRAGGERSKSIAQSLACRAAVMAGDKVGPEEAISLFLRLTSAHNPYCCPHGRPTFIKITREELDGRFGRK